MTAAEVPTAVAVVAGTGSPVELGPDGGRVAFDVVAFDVVAPPAAILTKTKFVNPSVEYAHA